MMGNTFFGLTTVSALAQEQIERDKWKSLFYENNETIERFQQLNKKLEIDLKESKIWAKHLEDTNKELTLKITALTVKQTAIRIAVDNFNLATKDI